MSLSTVCNDKNVGQIYKESLGTGVWALEDKDRGWVRDRHEDENESSRSSQYTKLDDCIQDID